MQSPDRILGISRMTNSVRRGPVLVLATALVFAACGALGGSGANATLCPPAALESVTVETKTFTPVTYAVLIDRAYTGDSKRSPSYPWPQLPRTACYQDAISDHPLDCRARDRRIAPDEFGCAVECNAGQRICHVFGHVLLPSQRPRPRAGFPGAALRLIENVQGA